jgi:hypothetical protein
MQSGKRNTQGWRLEYDPDEPLTLDPLMGWTSSGDMKRQIRLSFPTKEEAIAYAERRNIPYRVYEPHETTPRPMAYADNFRANRRVPWTH